MMKGVQRFDLIGGCVKKKLNLWNGKETVERHSMHLMRAIIWVETLYLL